MTCTIIQYGAAEENGYDICSTFGNISSTDVDCPQALLMGCEGKQLFDVDDIEGDEAAAILEASTEALVFDHRCALEDDGLDPDEIDRR